MQWDSSSGSFSFKEPDAFFTRRQHNWIAMGDQMMMEEEEEERYRKRTRDHPSLTPSHQSSTKGDDQMLEISLKKVRISKQAPGQIRLQQDVGECLRENLRGLQAVKIDAKNPLHAYVRLAHGMEFQIIAGRHYPHHPPVIIALATGARIHLPILNNWLPVYTLSSIIIQLTTPSDQVQTLSMQ